MCSRRAIHFEVTIVSRHKLAVIRTLCSSPWRQHCNPVSSEPRRRSSPPHSLLGFLFPGLPPLLLVMTFPHPILPSRKIGSRQSQWSITW